jgi:hypothetical protein
MRIADFHIRGYLAWALPDIGGIAHAPRPGRRWIMTRYRHASLALVTIVATAAGVAEWVLAQTPMAPGPPPAQSDTTGPGGIGLLLVVVAVLLAVLITAIRLYDMKRRQEDSAMMLQAKLSDALLQEASLAGSPITATVHTPMRKRSPIMVDVAGPVASPELRDTVLRIVRRETAGTGREVQIEDRMVVTPKRTMYAA